MDDLEVREAVAARRAPGPFGGRAPEPFGHGAEHPEVAARTDRLRPGLVHAGDRQRHGAGAAPVPLDQETAERVEVRERGEHRGPALRLAEDPVERVEARRARRKGTARRHVGEERAERFGAALDQGPALRPVGPAAADARVPLMRSPPWGTADVFEKLDRSVNGGRRGR